MKGGFEVGDKVPYLADAVLVNNNIQQYWRDDVWEISTYERERELFGIVLSVVADAYRHGTIDLKLDDTRRGEVPFRDLLCRVSTKMLEKFNMITK